MKRRSKRELERALEELDSDATGSNADRIQVLYRNDRTGELLAERGGDPADPDPEADLTVVIEQSVVVSRDRAEAEGYEILGPAEDVPDGRDAVRVAWESDDR